MSQSYYLVHPEARGHRFSPQNFPLVTGSELDWPAMPELPRDRDALPPSLKLRWTGPRVLNPASGQAAPPYPILTDLRPPLIRPVPGDQVRDVAEVASLVIFGLAALAETLMLVFPVS